MNTLRNSLFFLCLSLGLAQAQVPSSFDASGSSLKDNSASSTSDSSTGEPANPQLLGMEMPLLDPATNTASYNGGKFDVGNNALVRARFEKYLQQVPDTSSEAKRYNNRINGILRITRGSNYSNSIVGSKTLSKIGRGLYDVSEFPADGGQANALATAILSALDVQRGVSSRNRENEALDNQIDELVGETNEKHNLNAARLRSKQPLRHVFTIGVNTKDIATKTGIQAKNDVTTAAALAMGKLNYQSLLMTMLVQRRFDHVVIGSRVYRHVFKDGDAKINIKEDSEAGRLVSDGSGMPATINTLDTLASTARRDADQSVQAVHNLLAQNRLGDATVHLINAVAIGEFMHSVTSFPAESRRRIATYWTLRKRSLTALNARDYGTLEEVAKKMKELDANFDDSLVMTYCAGKKRLSDLHIRNAMKAMQAGNEEEFNKQITLAGSIWPRNPNLDKGVDKLKELDNREPDKAEFRTLLARKDYRTIYNEQDRFEIVAIDPELKKDYKDVLTLVATLDAMLEQLEDVAKQDKRMGPCVAYETLLEKGEDEPRFTEDVLYKDAIARYENQAYEFVKSLREAKESAVREENGSALSAYQRALCIYPSSKLAKKGSNEQMQIIMRAKFD